MKYLKGSVFMNELNLPADFIKNIHNSFDEQGVQFIKDLPCLIADASQLWRLYDVRFVPNLSYNFVSFANRGGEDVILKIGLHNQELTSEMEALKLFNGNGACRLFGCDEKRGFLLLERLKPGKMLAELENDDERTHIAVDVMSRLWREAPADNNYIQLTGWFDALKKIRQKFDGGTGPFPKKLLERVESFLPGLLAEENLKLIHGDFHHFNILLSERGWLAIDPKGVIGPAGYEIGPLMINPWGSLSDGINFKAQTKRRMGILSERLGWDRASILLWSTAHAVLSAWWDMREDGSGGEYSLWCAEMFSEIK